MFALEHVGEFSDVSAAEARVPPSALHPVLLSVGALRVVTGEGGKGGKWGNRGSLQTQACRGGSLEAASDRRHGDRGGTPPSCTVFPTAASSSGGECTPRFTVAVVLIYSTGEEWPVTETDKSCMFSLAERGFLVSGAGKNSRVHRVGQAGRFIRKGWAGGGAAARRLVGPGNGLLLKEGAKYSRLTGGPGQVLADPSFPSGGILVLTRLCQNCRGNTRGGDFPKPQC